MELSPPPTLEEQISVADDKHHDALVELIELLAMKDPRYGTKDGYPRAMHDAALDLLDTIAIRFQNGQIV